MLAVSHDGIMFYLSYISGIVGGLLYVALVIIVLNYFSVMFSGTSGRLTIPAIGITLLPPDAGLALRFLE